RAISAGWNRCCDTVTPHPVQCGPTKGFSNFAVAAPGQRFSWARAVEVNAPMKMPRNAIIVNLLSINTSLARMNRARCRTTGKGDFDEAVRRWGERVGDDSKLDESCTDDPGPIRNFGFRINGVPTLLEQNELIAVVMLNFFTVEDGKRLLNRHLFKKRDTENLQNRKQTAVKIETFLDNGDEQVDRDRRPDLSFNGVFGGAIERFDSEMLF